MVCEVDKSPCLRTVIRHFDHQTKWHMASIATRMLNNQRVELHLENTAFLVNRNLPTPI